jgi:coenzyme F420-0:L-glutamate ligase/coenzyme F420-1:gamma-L-glutamate ligase
VLLRGRAELLAPGSPEQARAVELLRQRYPQYQAMRLETQSMIALRIERVSVWGKLE